MKPVREVPMLELDSVVHRYGEMLALDNVSLTAGRGEFLTILGESGSGKTTLLRVISGLERPSSAQRMVIDEEDVAGLPPAKRNCTTVFQNYALFPHMSVGENVAYGLKVRHVPKDEAQREMLKALETVQLGGMENRRASELSGGQKQRVAIARSIVTKPAIMLLDEPLGALDERLRIDMQAELVDLQRRLGMTFIYITHSQEEALSMSDRVVLMRRGRIEQQGTPTELFDRPRSSFAATFMGFENLISGQVAALRGDRVEVGLPGLGTVSGVWTSDGLPEPGAQVHVAVRAERLVPIKQGDTSAASGLNVLPCRPLDQRYRGKYSDRSVETGAGTLKMRSWDRAKPADDFDAVSWHPDDCVILAATA
jgi:putative spermidine/putrescine transport system ATP-binding protein/spermidine/putrescine transport system ATP-binding protein